MDFFELIETRYSSRAYRPDPVPEDLLHRVLEAGRLAPTAANRQGFRIVVAPTEGRREDILRIYGKPWFADAPLIIGVCTIDSETWHRRLDGKSFHEVDAAIVMDHMILAAAELGLGTCWVAAFDPEAAREVLDLPEGWEPVIFTTLGFPADQSKPKRRKPLDDLVVWRR